MTQQKEESVRQAMRPIFEAVVARTDAFCKEHLDEEYAQLSRKLAAALGRKRPSPLTSGKVEVWACAIVYELGNVNFLFDKTQTPHTTSGELCEWFGVSQRTASDKARMIRNALRIEPFDPRWWRPSRMDDNPVAWMIELNGFIVDVRREPREIQEEAYRRGLIPYLPRPR